MPRYAANPEPVRRISSLADLLAYLRDKLGWPISQETVIDDLTFDWSAGPGMTAPTPKPGSLDPTASPLCPR